MKTALIILSMATGMGASTITDGSGFFPVVVMVMQPDGVTPVQGASVRLADLPEYREVEIDPKKRIRIIPDTLGKPSLTDAKGCAVVMFHGRWGSTTQHEKTTYRQNLVGTLVVEREKMETFRVAMKDWAEKNKYSPQSNAAPFITVVLKPKEHATAEQVGGCDGEKPAS